MLSKSLSTSQKFAALYPAAGELAEFCQSLYPLIVSHTDDFGRLQGDPFTVKHQCHPASPRSLDEFAAALRFLHEVELLIWYEVGGRKYVQISHFEDHQTGLHKRTQSSFPRIPGSSGKVKETPGQLKGREEKRTEEKRERARAFGMAPIIGRNPHLKHSACDPSLSRCVPQAVHDKLADSLAPQHNGDRDAAKAVLQAWYQAVWKTLDAKFTIGDAFKFWQGRFDATFATKDAAQTGQRATAPSADKTADYLSNLRAGRPA